MRRFSRLLTRLSSKRSLLRMGTSLVALAVGLEVAGRIGLAETSLGDVVRPSIDPQEIFELIPHQTTVVEGAGSGTSYSVQIDALGRRATPAGQPSCSQIWVIGDSFPFGWGVSDGEAYPSLLGEAMRDLEGCRPSVSNLGVPGYHLGQSLQRAERHLQTALPDLVLLHIVDNDGFTDFNYHNPLGFPTLFTRHLKLTEVLGLLTTAAFEMWSRRPKERAQQEQRLIDRIGDWAGLVEAQPFALVPLMEPSLHTSAVRAEVRERLGQEITLEPCSEPKMLIEGDGHYSIEGHRCIVDRVVDGLRARRHASPPKR